MDISEIGRPNKSKIADIDENNKFKNAFKYSPLPTVIFEQSGNIFDTNLQFNLLFGRNTTLHKTESIFDVLSSRSVGKKSNLRSLIYSNDFKVKNQFKHRIKIKDVTNNIHDYNITCYKSSYNGKQSFIMYFEVEAGFQKDSIAQNDETTILKSVFRAYPIMIGTVKNRVIIDANDKFFDLLGYSRKEIIGKDAMVLYPSREDYEFVGTEKYRQIQENGVGMVVTRWKKKDGDIVDILLSSAVKDPDDDSLGVLFVAMDITKQKENERQLQHLVQQLGASEEKYRRLVEISPTAIFLTSGCENIEDCNPSTEKLLGASREELIGTNYRKFFSGWRLFTENMEEIDNAIEQKGYYLHKEFQFKNHLGELYYLNLFITFVILNGKFYTLTIGHDVTDLVLYRKEIEESKKQLQQLNKELKSFSFSITHDLRAPLRRIKGFSEIISEDYTDVLDEQGLNIFHRIISNIELMEKQVKGMLTLSKVTQRKLEFDEVDLSDLVKRTLDSYKSTDKKRLTDFNIETGVTVQADPILMQILIQNLIDNAWKFSSNRDVTKIRFGRRDIKPNEFFLTDNGDGFDYNSHDDYQKQRLFAPFQRLHSDNEFSGIGIGMATVKRIINLHDGDIWVESKKNIGTTIFFKI